MRRKEGLNNMTKAIPSRELRTEDNLHYVKFGSEESFILANKGLTDWTQAMNPNVDDGVQYIGEKNAESNLMGYAPNVSYGGTAYPSDKFAAWLYSVGKEEQKKGRDIMWYIWAAPNSPLFGKSKMSTFERYFIEDPSTHEEKKNAYYRLWENEEVVDNMLREFGLDPEKGHIINGHVPVHQSEGESPVKCDGKVIVIDGGFSKPYQKVTGIAGYTLIYNYYGLNLTAHEPFTSKADAVARETDIVSNRVAVSYMSRRQLVGDTDTGHALKERIQELIQLLDAYRTGIIKEKK